MIFFVTIAIEVFFNNYAAFIAKITNFSLINLCARAAYMNLLFCYMK